MLLASTRTFANNCLLSAQHWVQMLALLRCREDPDHPKALFRQAAVRSVLGDFDEAEEGYRWFAHSNGAIS